MLIAAKVSFETNNVRFKGTSQLTPGLTNPSITFTASAGLQTSSNTYSFGISTLPALEAIGGDESFIGYGIGDVSFPSLASSGDGGLYVPVEI